MLRQRVSALFTTNFMHCWHAIYVNVHVPIKVYCMYSMYTCTCMCPSVHPILHFKFPKFFIDMYFNWRAVASQPSCTAGSIFLYVCNDATYMYKLCIAYGTREGPGDCLGATCKHKAEIESSKVAKHELSQLTS